MKKLDEIMELMTDEMADFKSSVLQLKEHSKELQNMSIPISTEAMEKNLNTFLEKQEVESRLKDDMLKSIDKKLKNAILIPKYILMIFGILGILSFGLLGYFGYTAKTSKEEKFEFLHMMINSENPEIKEDYCLWLEGKK